MQCLRTESDATDRRDAIVLGRATQDDALAAAGQSPADQRHEHEARFVQESNVCLAAPRFAEDAWELISFPAFHLLVVALAGAPLRLVAGPVQAPQQQAADIVGMVLDAEVAADYLRDAGRGPQ